METFLIIAAVVVLVALALAALVVIIVALTGIHSGPRTAGELAVAAVAVVIACPAIVGAFMLIDYANTKDIPCGDPPQEWITQGPGGGLVCVQEVTR